MTDPASFRLTVCGLDELPHHRASGVSHILSLLDPDTPDPEMLLAHPPHRRMVLRFHDVIEKSSPRGNGSWGAVAPEEQDIARLLDFAREALGSSSSAQPAHLLAHCHAGISRSTAAGILILATARPASSGEAIVEELLHLRPQAWPNLLILELGDKLLGRGGEILDAAATLYRRALLREPSLAWAMRMGGRGREVRWADLGKASEALGPRSL